MREFDREAFAARVASRMMEMGLNQVQMAARAGMQQGTLSRILGRDRSPSADVLITIAEALGVSIDYLAGRSDDSDVGDLMCQERYRDLVTRFHGLPPADQDRVLALIDALALASARK